MKILIADDHPIVRSGLQQIILGMMKGGTIVETSDGNETLEQIKNDNFDLIIMDISMPGKSGLDILTTMKNKNLPTPVLILSIHPQEQYAVRALKSGAAGYVCKSSVNEELLTAIKTILAGGKYLSPELTEKIMFHHGDVPIAIPHEKLSKREFQIMCLLAQGKSVVEIAAELFISDKTVSTHRRRLLEKMGMKKNAELIHYAIRNQLIE